MHPGRDDEVGSLFELRHLCVLTSKTERPMKYRYVFIRFMPVERNLDVAVCSKTNHKRRPRLSGIAVKNRHLCPLENRFPMKVER